jgi:DNA-binding beta-propeller fold protein YncE
MRLIRPLGSTILLFLALAPRLYSQSNPNPDAPRPLVLTEAIPTPGVQGRFDHFGFDGGNRLFVSALGNNSVEVIDISARVRDRSLTGIPRPQGALYAPDAKKLFVASSQGVLRIFDGTNYNLLKEIDFHGDVDNLRYDASTHRVYVGYGEEETGAIGAVDALTNERLPEEYKLGAHPESFQLESIGPNIYVNLPDLKQIAVINRKTGAISRWPMRLEHNFPMALDEADHRLFVVTHEPARLAVFDTATGRSIEELPCVQDADDIYYDPARKRIYISGGEGFISVFQQADPDHYSLLAKVPSTLGARTAGYFGKGHKGFDRYFLGVPARADHGAEIWLYTVQD